MQPQATPPPRRQKGAAPAYILWVIPGLLLGLSVHRFYLGRNTSASLQIGLSAVAWMLFIVAIILLGNVFGGIIPEDTSMLNDMELMELDMQAEMLAMENAGSVAGASLLALLAWGLIAARFIWHIVDLFLIPGLLRERNEEQYI